MIPKNVTPFVEWAEGEDVSQAFRNARSLARLFDGIGRYQGMILAKPGYIEVDVPESMIDGTGDRVNRAILSGLEYCPRVVIGEGKVALDIDQFVDEFDELQRVEPIDNQDELDAADDLRVWAIVLGSGYVLESLAHYCDLDGRCLAVKQAPNRWSFMGMVDWPVRHPSRR